jgi:hypothetical protein
MHSEELGDFNSSNIYYSGDKIKACKMSSACGTHSRKDMQRGFWLGNRQESDCLQHI